MRFGAIHIECYRITYSEHRIRRGQALIPLSKLGPSKSAHSTGASGCLERKAKFSCRDKPSKWIAGNVRTPPYSLRLYT